MRRFWITSCLFAFLACGGGDGGSGEGGEGAAASAAPLGNSSITGVISFAGSVPTNPTIDMAEEPDCAAKHSDGPTDPIVVVADGKLAHVFIRVVGGLPDGPYPEPSEAATINQDGCLYSPRVLGVMVGQTLEITNSDPTLHNIHASPTANDEFNMGQPIQGMRFERTFDSPEIMVPFRCDVHSWMNANVLAVDNPYAVLTGSDGSFILTEVPAGTYTVEIWHSELGIQTMEVTVEAGDTATINAEF